MQNQLKDPYKLLQAAYHALRSYQHGNGSKELAKGIADEIDDHLRAKAHLEDESLADRTRHAVAALKLENGE